MHFQEGDHVFIKVTLTKGASRFGRRGKLKPIYIGPFDILEHIGDTAYQIALPPSLEWMHNVFHVSILQRYIANPSHLLQQGDFDGMERWNIEQVQKRILDR